MKKTVMPLMALVVAFSFACNNNATTTSDNKDSMDSKDKVEVADDKNEAHMDSTGTEHMEDDQEFMVEAASGGMMEVELGKLAGTNAMSADVKAFGATMKTDHTKANDELKALAAKKNVTLPQGPGEMHQKHIDGLKDKKGAEFDKDYISMMVDDHEDDIKKFEKAAQDAKDPELKAFATKTLPTLKHHLEMAKKINDSMKK